MTILNYLFIPFTTLLTALYSMDDGVSENGASDAFLAEQSTITSHKPARLGTETFVISYPENCKVLAVNIDNNDMRASVDCNGESKVHKWDVNAVGKAVATTPLSHDGTVGLTVFNTSSFDWAANEQH